MKKFSLALLIILWTNVAYAEVVDLTCKIRDDKFYVGLDFKNSKWLFENGRSTYMYSTKEKIYTVTRSKDESDFTHKLWFLSRITGVGEIKGYRLTDEDLKLVADNQLINIKRNMIGDMNNKSLDPARNKLRAKVFAEYLENKSGDPINIKFECEKSETKYKF